MKNKKKLLFLLVIVAAVFLLSGCTVPMEEGPDGTKQIILITTETTFKSMIDNESWFSAIFVWPMAQAINALAPTTSVAAAIAIVTAVVNAVVLLFTIKPTISMQRMQMIQPELTKIQKKYEGKTDEASKMRMSQETMDLYKKYNINPFTSMAVQFIQLPILIAVYHAVQRSQAVKTGSFLGLSLQQTPWTGIKNGEFLYIALFIVMLAAQLLSMKLPQWIAEYKGRKEAEKHHRKYVKPQTPGGNMMYSMMAVILILAITWPAAMTLYWIISSTVTIIKTLLVQFVFMREKPEL